MESMQGVYPDRASGYTIGLHPDNIPPGCLFIRMALLRRHSIQMYQPPFHPDVSQPRTFHPDGLHPEIYCADIPSRCLTSDTFHLIFCIRHLTPDGRAGRFNFPGQTYPDPLIALTQRVSQPFCTVPWCSPKASRYLRPTF